MTPEQFEKVVLNRCEKIQSVMASKNKEYATDSNKLHNFDKAARISGQTREKALWGMALKHYVSIDDLIENVGKGKLPSTDLLSEKIGDMVNYLILLEASVMQRIAEEREKIIEAFANNPES